MITGEIIKGHTGPIAVASKCGWMLIDPVKLCGTVPTHTAPNLVISGYGATQPPGDDNAFVDALRNFWDLDSLGIIETKEGKGNSWKTSHFPVQGTRLVFHGNTVN